MARIGVRVFIINKTYRTTLLRLVRNPYCASRDWTGKTLYTVICENNVTFSSDIGKVYNPKYTINNSTVGYIYNPHCCHVIVSQFPYSIKLTAPCDKLIFGVSRVGAKKIKATMEFPLASDLVLLCKYFKEGLTPESLLSLSGVIINTLKENKI